jgi:hypothetical protein
MWPRFLFSFPVHFSPFLRIFCLKRNSVIFLLHFLGKDVCLHGYSGENLKLSGIVLIPAGLIAGPVGLTCTCIHLTCQRYRFHRSRLWCWPKLPVPVPVLHPSNDICHFWPIFFCFKIINASGPLLYIIITLFMENT